MVDRFLETWSGLRCVSVFAVKDRIGGDKRRVVGAGNNESLKGTGPSSLYSLIHSNSK